MPKKFHAPKLDEVEPQGPVTVAAAPLAVVARVRWIIAMPTDWSIIRDAWALAWTKNEVLVVWMTAGKATTTWIPAKHVKRR